jgi:rhodanese-related sulfurtransferase
MSRKQWLCVAVTTLFVLILLPTAFAAETPSSAKNFTVVDSTKAKSLMDAGAVVVDARVANEYVESHIKGAKSIPYKEKSAKAIDFDSSLDSFDIAKLPADKSGALVFYCNGAECWKSYKAATLAFKAGYKRVFWLRAGIPEWKSKGFPVE